tara:strand:- start:51 stop:245 length:195 start_codon:yes stop_codon:yes gene_type:complete
MFQLGDKVCVKAEHKKELFDRYRADIGTVVIEQHTKAKQWCRVQFSNSMLDYEDYGSWRLKLVG